MKVVSTKYIGYQAMISNGMGEILLSLSWQARNFVLALVAIR